MERPHSINVQDQDREENVRRRAGAPVPEVYLGTPEKAFPEAGFSFESYRDTTGPEEIAEGPMNQPLTAVWLLLH